jgi:hypothetical protein
MKVHNDVTEEQKSIKLGDAVIVTKDDGTKVETNARSDPFQANGSDLWVIFLKGISGYYALSRVVKNDSANT